MYSNKFYLALKQLENREQKEFEDYLFTNHAKKEIAIKVYLFFKEKEVEEIKNREVLFKSIFNKKSNNNYRKLTDAFSDLYLLLEEFLIWKALLRKEIPEADFILLEVFKRRNFQKLYQQKLNQIEKKRKSQNPEVAKGMWSFFDNMKLEHYQYFFSDDAKLSKNDNRIRAAMDQLDLFFVATKLRYSCELASRENILQEQHDIQLLDEVVEFCQKDKRFDTVYFNVYQYTFELIKSQKHKDYLKLKRLFLKNTHVFDAKELMGIFSYLINYTAVEIKRGRIEFMEEAFQLYQQGLKEWAFIENNYMPHTRFNNIINLGCRLRKFEWTKQFIERWANYLESGIRNSAIDIGLSRLSFEQGEYEQVIKQLNGVKFSNSFYAIRAKTLMMRSHFELKTAANVQAHMAKAFINYIRRNRTINDETKEGFLNFTKTLLKIIKGKHQREDLKNKIKVMSPVVYKEWLLDQV